MALIMQPTHQYAMTVVVPVEDKDFASLQKLLEKISGQTIAHMQGNLNNDTLVPFHEVESLHYGRFLLVEESTKHGDPALLVLSTNYDGPLEKAERDEKSARAAHLEDLVNETYDGLDDVFGHCKGYESGSGSGALRDFLASDRHQVPAQTFYTGSSGRSRGQILEEYKLRKKIEKAADEVAASRPRCTRPAQVRRDIIEKLQRAGVEIPPRFPPQPDGKSKVARTLILLVSLILGVFVGVGPWLFSLISGTTLSFGTLALRGFALLGLLALALYLTLRTKERLDRPAGAGHDKETTDYIKYASAGENLFMQNQLTSVVEMKSGWFRLMTIKTVFFLLQLLATYVFNRGKLGNIPSIHFARWVFLGKRRRVLFFSNFDNSWQSYLGDFVDQASTGLTAVWSNTKGYPRTKNLLFAGAKNSTSFLAWVRASQLPTDVWYSAYPALSIKNVNNNTLLRRGIADPGAVSATDWLRALAGEDLIAQKPSEKSDPRPAHAPLPVEDIQGIILKGYGFLANAAFIMLRVKDATAARKWIGQLPITPASEASKHGYEVHERKDQCFVNIAFTHPGLDALELGGELLDGFPLEFVSGSHERSRILGDVGKNAPDEWAWGSPKEPVHVLLMVYGHTEDILKGYRERYEAEAEANGLELIVTLGGHTLPGRKEHFGFRDGIAQPHVRANPLWKKDRSKFNEIAPGEFLLGYDDGYRTPKDKGDANVAFAPRISAKTPFAKGGSYLVFRQLEQDVAAFWRYCDEIGESIDDLPVETVASKMVGRWPNGEPLVLQEKGPAHPDEDSDEDRFGYLNKQDLHGDKCPFGAHVRRSNPRDWLLGANPVESMRLANLHRIMRRGRPYGPPLVKDLGIEELIEAAKSNDADSESRGLNFICFNANIERQFEFVQQQWINNAQLSEVLGEADPLMGRHHRPDEGIGGGDPEFTVQEEPLRAKCPDLTQFVTVKGSSYFFMPPLSAVEYIGTI